MTLQLGILLALVCALATNLGFLLKHKGACAAPDVSFRHPVRSAAGLFKSKWFAIGMLVAVGAWIFHVAALALAPLSLVQAVISGGLVLLTVLAERFFGFSVGSRQWFGVGLTALGLVLLAVTIPTGTGAHSSYSLVGMIAFESVLTHSVGTDGIVTGLLLSPWLVTCIAASVLAFFASARGLQKGEAVPVITLTSAGANVAAITGGFVVFGDPMPNDPIGITVQCFAFVLVIAAAALTPAPLRATAEAR